MGWLVGRVIGQAAKKGGSGSILLGKSGKREFIEEEKNVFFLAGSGCLKLGKKR